MFAPSVDVGDDLRQYARKREEEMRDRVEAHRKLKEDELKQELSKKVEEYEITKLLSENKHLLEQRSCLDDIESMCKRLKHRLRNDTVAHPAPEPDPVSEELWKELTEQLDRIRFEKECDILAVYKEAEKALRDAQKAAQEELRSGVANQVEKRLTEVAEEIVMLRNDVAELRDSQRISSESNIAELNSSSNRLLQDAHQKILGTLEDESESLRSSVKARLEAHRRRSVIALEKRIVDLSRHFDSRSSPEAIEAKALYQSELRDLMLVYVENIRRSGNWKPRENISSGTIAANMESNNVSEKNQIKFIASFFEKFSCPELLVSLTEALSQGDSLLSLGS
jgi:hypothetical protein